MTAIFSPAPVAAHSLVEALEIQDFQKSNALYNELLDDSKQPPVAEDHISNLAALFVRHNAERVFGIHLIHGHFKIPEDTVMLGTSFENPSIRWTRTTNIRNIDPTSIHGHVFASVDGVLCAYEFQDGALPDLSGVDTEFLPAFMEYIGKNNLTGLIGLQLLCGDDGPMSELILEDGTVMLDSTIVKNTVPTCVTGWRFEMVDGNPRVCQSNETHAKKTSGTHQVFNAGKPLPRLENIEDLKAALVEANII